MKFKNIFILTIISISVLLVSCKKNTKNNPKVKNGIIILNNFDDSKIYPLQGDWEFYWNQLLEPKDIKFFPKDSIKYIYVNGGWNDFLYNGTKIKGYGNSTYHLKIVVPKGQYAIKFRQILSSYKVWINDSLACQVGNPGNPDTYVPKILPKEVFFVSNKDTIDIVVQVSNYSHRLGGIQELVTFGKPNTVTVKVKNNLDYTFFILGAESIFALYFLLTFIFRRKNIAYLYFCFCIITTLLFEITNGEMLFMRFLPEISSFELTKKIDFLSNYSRLTFFALFFWSLFKENKIINKHIFRIIIIVSVILDLFVLFTPCRIYSETLMIYMGIGLIIFLYFTFSLFYGLIKKVPNIIFSLIGMLIFVFGLIHDILFNLNLFNSVYLINTGLLIFFIMQSIILALNYSTTQSSVNILSNRFLILKRIRNSFLEISSYNLPQALENICNEYECEKIEILVFNENKTYCECKKVGNKILFAKMEQNLVSDFDENLYIDSIVKRKSLLFHKGQFSVFTMPLIQNNKINAVFLIGRIKKFTREQLKILEDLSSQICVIFDNYNYYWRLDNINKNLEYIIEKRTQLVYKQKEELIEKSIELDQKIEELKISSQIVDELNQELIYNRKEITNAQQKLIKQQNKINQQKAQLDEKTKNINSSINYSQKIHNALFKINQTVEKIDYFEFTAPKDIVSGDFWSIFNSNKKIYIALADSTAKNVSSTFLSFLILSIIEEILTENNENDISTGEMLNILKDRYVNLIGADYSSRIINDSFDISLISFDKNKKVIEFSGAGQPILIIRKSENIILEPDLFSIGGHQHFFDKTFNTKKIEYKKNDLVYLFSDGFSNQIIKESNQKFGLDNFTKFINSISLFPFEKQQEELTKKFENLKQNIRQIDDALVVGIKFLI